MYVATKVSNEVARAILDSVYQHNGEWGMGSKMNTVRRKNYIIVSYYPDLLLLNLNGAFAESYVGDFSNQYEVVFQKMDEIEAAHLKGNLEYSLKLKADSNEYEEHQEKVRTQDSFRFHANQGVWCQE